MTFPQNTRSYDQPDPLAFEAPEPDLERETLKDLTPSDEQANVMGGATWMAGGGECDDMTM